VKNLRTITKVLIALVVVSLFAVGGLADYPCFVDQERIVRDMCVLGLREPHDSLSASEVRIEAQITTASFRYSGGGCLRIRSNVDHIRAPTSLDLRFDRNENTLRINGRTVDEGAEYQTTGFWNFDPWGVVRLRVKNLGVVPDCQLDTANNSLPNPSTKRVLLAGSECVEFSPAKGGVILAALIFVLFGLRRVEERRIGRRTLHDQRVRS
jgi:hypothetical protein